METRQISHETKERAWENLLSTSTSPMTSEQKLSRFSIAFSDYSERVRYWRMFELAVCFRISLISRKRFERYRTV